MPSNPIASPLDTVLAFLGCEELEEAVLKVAAYLGPTDFFHSDDLAEVTTLSTEDSSAFRSVTAPSLCSPGDGRPNIDRGNKISEENLRMAELMLKERLHCNCCCHFVVGERWSGHQMLLLCVIRLALHRHVEAASDARLIFSSLLTNIKFGN